MIDGRRLLTMEGRTQLRLLVGDHPCVQGLHQADAARGIHVVPFVPPLLLRLSSSGSRRRHGAADSLPILSKFEPRHLSNLAYAYALAGNAPKLEDGTALFDHIAEKSIPSLGKFIPQGLNCLTNYRQTV